MSKPLQAVFDLLRKAGVDANALDLQGRTALQYRAMMETPYQGVLDGLQNPGMNKSIHDLERRIASYGPEPALGPHGFKEKAQWIDMQSRRGSRYELQHWLIKDKLQDSEV